MRRRAEPALRRAGFFLKVMSCRMKKRDKALRLPTIRRLRIAATASSNVRSGCSAISANNQLACSSKGETLPPLGFAAELPSSRQRRSQLITVLGLTSKSPATSCREAPPSTSLSLDPAGRPNTAWASQNPSEENQERQTRSSTHLWESPRFDPAGICSRVCWDLGFSSGPGCDSSCGWTDSF